MLLYFLLQQRLVLISLCGIIYCFFSLFYVLFMLYNQINSYYFILLLYNKL